jgi:hypothetical protein
MNPIVPFTKFKVVFGNDFPTFDPMIIDAGFSV